MNTKIRGRLFGRSADRVTSTAEKTMSTEVAVAPPTVPDELVSGIEPAFKAACEKRGAKKLICHIITRDLTTIWTTQLDGAPRMLGKVAKAKAKSFHAGKKLLSPDGCTTMCCHFCPWACGCTSHMTIQGVVPMELTGTAASCLVVAGAPMGSTDLQIAEELLTECGFTKVDDVFKKGGSPDNAEMAR